MQGDKRGGGGFGGEIFGEVDAVDVEEVGRFGFEGGENCFADEFVNALACFVVVEGGGGAGDGEEASGNLRIGAGDGD